MAISLSSDRVRVPAHVVARVVPGATVLLNTETGGYFTLDEVGGRVWASIAVHGTAQAVYDGLLAEYRVDPEQLREDLERLLESLGAAGLVEVRHER